MAGLKSQGIPSLRREEKNGRGGRGVEKKDFPKEKLLVEVHVFVLKHKYGQRYGAAPLIHLPPDLLYPSFSLAIHISPEKTALLLNFCASVPARQLKQGSIKQQMLMLAHA